ncbi:MAG: chemotaxis protein CheW [Beijerinckiaceae bacterium]
MTPVNDNSGLIAGPADHPCLLVPCAGMIFALPIAQVEDVFNAPPITPVPLAPVHVIGLLNLRGKIVTAICLAGRLGLQDDAPRKGPPLIIGVAHGQESFGLAVNAVGEVVPLPVAQREPVPPHVAAGWTACATALHQTDAGLIIELDLARLLTLDSGAAAA